MASLQEIVNKIFSLDNTKDYDFSVAEKQQQLVQNNVPPTTIVPPVIDPETPPPMPKDKLLNQMGSTVEQQASDIEGLKNEIETLKAANLALLQRMPVQQEEKSLETMIYELCVPQRKE